MANFLSRLIRGKGNVETQDLQQNLRFEAGRQALFDGPDEQERAEKKDLGIKERILNDDDADIVLAQKCIKLDYAPATDDQGNIVYMRDSEGKVIVNEQGQPLISYKQVVGVNNQFAALQRMLSPVNRCTFSDPKNKRLIALKMEDIIEDVKMSLPEAEFDLGIGCYLDSLDASLIMLLDDATNGSKVKSLLEYRKIQTLDIMNQKQKGLM